MRDAVVIRAAEARDLSAAEGLLREADLPWQVDQFPQRYVVAVSGARMVGVGGLERHDDVGLLRSVVVAEEYRGTGLGRHIVEQLLARAEQDRLTSVYLLTTTAAGYFPRLGFTTCERSAAPPVIQDTPQFASLCPSAACCLVWRPPATEPLHQK